MVTEGMKTSALWQQINGSLSPQISRTLNKIWHNSIILKQALSEHTLSREMQERKVLRRTASQVCWKFWLSLSTFWILFWLFTWIRFELACVWKAHRATLYVTVSVCLKRGSYVVLVQFRKTSWDRQLLNQVLHTHFHTCTCIFQLWECPLKSITIYCILTLPHPLFIEQRRIKFSAPGRALP